MLAWLVSTIEKKMATNGYTPLANSGKVTKQNYEYIFFYRHM